MERKRRRLVEQARANGFDDVDEHVLSFPGGTWEGGAQGEEGAVETAASRQARLDAFAVNDIPMRLEPGGADEADLVTVEVGAGEGYDDVAARLSACVGAL